MESPTLVTLTPDSAFELSTFASLDEAAQLTAPLLTGSVAVSGGETFAALFRCWAALDTQRFETVSFFPVDERVVPFDDPHSNWGAAWRLLLNSLGHHADKSHWAQSASQYESVLRSHFPEWPPVFDAILLGVGDDGHTASLFPGESSLEDRSSIVLDTRSPKPPVHRVTLAPSVIAAAKTVCVVVSGSGKASILRRMIEGDMSLPITRVLSLRARSLVLAEAALLPWRRCPAFHAR
jgi:6-phosphogluconolactonase